MAKSDFNWDQYFNTLSLNDAKQRSPLLIGNRTPSLFNEDETAIYLSSVDEAFDTDDAEGLEEILGDIKEAFNGAQDRRDFYKMAVAKVDYDLVYQLLTNNGITVAGHSHNIEMHD